MFWTIIPKETLEGERGYRKWGTESSLGPSAIWPHALFFTRCLSSCLKVINGAIFSSVLPGNVTDHCCMGTFPLILGSNFLRLSQSRWVSLCLTWLALPGNIAQKIALRIFLSCRTFVWCAVIFSNCMPLNWSHFSVWWAGTSLPNHQAWRILHQHGDPAVPGSFRLWRGGSWKRQKRLPGKKCATFWTDPGQKNVPKKHALYPHAKLCTHWTFDWNLHPALNEVRDASRAVERVNRNACLLLGLRSWKAERNEWLKKGRRNKMAAMLRKRRSKRPKSPSRGEGAERETVSCPSATF